jgi:hypothetical protein
MPLVEHDAMQSGRCLSDTFTTKTEAAGFSETLVITYPNTWLHVAKYLDLYYTKQG